MAAAPPDHHRGDHPTAFVLAGGGSLGAVQVGMLHALSAAGLAPDLLVGTSVGAINAAFIAGGASPDDISELERIWRDVRRTDIFPLRPLWGLRAVLTGADAAFSPHGLRRLVAGHLCYARLEDAPIPPAIVAADVISGREVVLRSGDPVQAVLASAAIPAVFPPVTIGEFTLVDGGFVNHTPISTAVELGAATVYVLPTGFPCNLAHRPRGALAVALHAVTNLLSQRLAADIAAYDQQVTLHVVPPPCPLEVSAADFSQTTTLIRRAESAARSWLDSNMPAGVAHALLPHHHPGASSPSAAQRPSA